MHFLSSVIKCWHRFENDEKATFRRFVFSKRKSKERVSGWSFWVENEIVDVVPNYRFKNETTRSENFKQNGFLSRIYSYAPRICSHKTQLSLLFCRVQWIGAEHGVMCVKFINTSNKNIWFTSALNYCFKFSNVEKGLNPGKLLQKLEGIHNKKNCS